MNEPNIIYEDQDMLVLNKPAGLLVHGEGIDPSGTLVEWFLQHSPEASGVGEPRVGKDGEELERSGIVHRLDKDTSGVMILAKNQKAFDHFKAQFKEYTAKKEYVALVYGLMKERWGTIDRPIGRSSSDWRLRSAERGSKGVRREASTDWECLKTGTYKGEPFSYLRLTPKTGRMHQLRVHLKAIGRPIVGDKLYATSKLGESNNLELDRLALHSRKLTVKSYDGIDLAFENPVPDALNEAIELIEE